MFFYQGYSCPVCEKPFQESDDVVVCPACGAPHHRDCWKQEGHCHFEATHGTAQQWKKEKVDNAQSSDTNKTQKRCPHCGYENSTFAEFCSHCGKDLQAEEWNSNAAKSEPCEPPQPPFGGYGEYRPFHAPSPDFNIPDDADIDGVTAKETRYFVGQNSHYYVPRFHKMSENQSSFSWNWAAFLLTPYWLWYRKQRVAGVLILLIEAVRTIVSAFFLYGYIGFSPTMSNAELTAQLEQLSANDTFRLWTSVMYLLLFVNILIRIFFGAFGNYIYYRLAKKRILKLRGQANSVAIVVTGGTSSALAVAAYVVLYLISVICNYIFL